MAATYYRDRYGRTRRLRRGGLIPARLYDAGERYSRELAREVLAEIRRTAPRRQRRYKEKTVPGRKQKYTVETESAGTLEKSFSVVNTDRGAAIVSSARYWQFVEFGTREHGPEQGTIRNAIEVIRAEHRGVAPEGLIGR